jgi:hypothetical protein
VPVVATLGALGIVVILIAVGWRQRWDTTPQDLPPVTLKTARADANVPPLPPWYLAVALAGPFVLFASTWLGYRWNRPWLIAVGYLLFGSGWAARQAAILWRASDTRLGRVAAVARPLTLLGGIAAAASIRSLWPVLPAGALYVAIPPVVDVMERRRRVHASGEPPRPG